MRRRSPPRCHNCNQPISFLADDRGRKIIVEPHGVLRGQVRFNSAQHQRHDTVCQKRKETTDGWQRTMDVLQS